MGTSTSCAGGKAGSPFDPEWLAGDANEDIAAGEGDAGDEMQAGEAGGEHGYDDTEDAAGEPAGSDEVTGMPEVAPDRRFASARTKMSAYLASGGRDPLRSAAKSMINKGMGGPRRAASTMRRTAQGAGQLGQFLAEARDGTDTRVRDWVERVRAADLSANDLVLELVKEVIPDTGSIDDESLRNAAAEALGKLYESDPDIDIFDLTDQQISDAIGYTIANDVCNRMDLQLGQTYERLKHQPQEVQRYRNDVKEWVHEEVRTVMEQYRTVQLNPQRLAREVLASALRVFAE
ncbi:Qat anti-phage system associated protein QatB [Modicisalibacter muralis]|nr:Qat anti-phage system associated protein QatB [Halomonas muralis]